MCYGLDTVSQSTKIDVISCLQGTHRLVSKKESAIHTTGQCDSGHIKSIKTCGVGDNYLWLIEKASEKF